MLYDFVVEFQVRKGLGPEYVQKLISVAYDDVDTEIPESVVKGWAKWDAEQYLRNHDCPVFIYVDIHYS